MHHVKSSMLLILVLLLFSGSCFAVDNKIYPNPPTQSVELYVTSWCPYCKMAEAYLDKQGVKYQKYDVEKDREAAKRMNQLAGGGGIPFAVINGVFIKGWSEGAYAEALKRHN
ncbi:glutaredoxin family protein [Geopsychrobacter electrodiphilus]|uniref:glutaredoxin family protein n=1 Tax=Geopsychrobacter electrodiphilus TaxID=225196 RepID=UPI000369064E|nr:glutaredoxin family protein [Geopsychrobacter electrodiphilus]